MESFTLITKKDLVEGFKVAGLQPGHVIMVHTSLKSFGYVVGGAQTVIEALLETIGETGTLMMPSQTWRNLDPCVGVHWEVPPAYWQLIRDNHPPYDKHITPAVGMGAVAAIFVLWPGVHRSDHPARSVAAYGPQADYLTRDHDLSNIFGLGSPLDKLYQLDGYVFLLGVNHNKNTSIHLGEVKAQFPSKAFTREYSAVLINGERRWVGYDTQAVDDSDFLALGRDYDRAFDTQVHTIGKSQVRYFKQKPFVDYCVHWLEAHRH